MKKHRFKNFIPTWINHGNLCIPSNKKTGEVKSVLSNCNLIFFASVGREGSGFMGNLFSEASECITFHERRPFANGRKLIENSMSNPYFSQRNNRVKLSKIADDITRTKARTYVESNHMFIKTFGKELLNIYDISFTLVSLRRPIVDTLKSFSDLNWFGKVFSRASNWVYKIDANTPLKRNELIIDSNLDEAIGYILSEKLNESNFLKNDQNKRINYIIVNIPPRDEDIKILKKLIGLDSPNFSLTSYKNTRYSLKTNSITKKNCEEVLVDFLLKNKLALLNQGISFNINSKLININELSWSII